GTAQDLVPLHDQVRSRLAQETQKWLVATGDILSARRHFDSHFVQQPDDDRVHQVVEPRRLFGQRMFRREATRVGLLMVMQDRSAASEPTNTRQVCKSWIVAAFVMFLEIAERDRGIRPKVHTNKSDAGS